MIDFTESDFITGNKFKSLADFEYLPGLELPTKDCIIYCKTDYLNEFIPKVENSSNTYGIISHNSDGNITNDHYKIRPYDYYFDHFPKNVKVWFAQNINVNHDRLVAIPIGLENEEWFPEVKKKYWMLEVMNNNQYKRDKMLYINHNIQTNPEVRAKPYEFFKDCDWVTLEHGCNNGNFLGYRNQLASHKYVLCPSGNGIDTHRVYEALYLGCIPIVQNLVCYKQLKNMFSMIVVDSFLSLQEIELNFWYKLNSNVKNYLNTMKFSFWKDYIKEIINGCN
jgi:hypothetical protein